MTDRQRNAFILALVLGLIAASVVVIMTKPTFLGLDLKGGVQLVYKGEPTAQSKVTQASLVDELFGEIDAWIAAGMVRPERKTRKLSLPVVAVGSV